MAKYLSKYMSARKASEKYMNSLISARRKLTKQIQRKMASYDAIGAEISKLEAQLNAATK